MGRKSGSSRLGLLGIFLYPTIALSGCVTDKEIRVNSNPPGAEVAVNLNGTWRGYGATPAMVEYYAWHAENYGGRVVVSREGYYPESEEFIPGLAPKSMEMDFDLEPLPAYAFSIESDPPGALVEAYREVWDFSPAQGRRVRTGRFGWVALGETPLEGRMLETPDGIVTVRLSKPGFVERAFNLPLGPEKYELELDEE